MLRCKGFLKHQFLPSKNELWRAIWGQRRIQTLFRPNDQRRIVIFSAIDEFKKGDITMTRKQLEKRFSLYPDVVTLQEFRQMLGGIGDKTARKLVRENRVKHFYIRNTYLIPKNHVIDYLLSTHYEKYRRQLKAHI